MNARNLLLALLLVLLAGDVEAQPGRGRRGFNRGGNGGGGPDNVPQAFRRAAKGRLRETERTIAAAMRWIAGDESDQLTIRDVADWFGGLERRPSDAELEDDPDAEPEPFGLFVLAGLKSDQITILMGQVDRQVPDLRKLVAKHRELQQKIRSVREEERPSRTLDREVVELGKEIGELEAAIALAQAETMRKLGESLSPDQFEYLRLLRSNSQAVNPQGPNVMKIRDAAAGLSPSQRDAVFTLAERACLFLTGDAAQNLATRPRGAADESAWDQLAGFLQSLNPIQQNQILLVLTGQQRLDADLGAKRLQAAALLDFLKSKNPKRTDPRKLARAAAELGGVEAQRSLLEARAFEQLRKSLSPAQQVFIRENLLD